MISHRNVMACLRQSERLGHVLSDDVLVSWVPPWHDLGLVRFIIEPVFRGLRCHIVPPAVRTIGEWLATISEVGGTISAAPDFAYRLACRWVDPADDRPVHVARVRQRRRAGRICPASRSSSAGSHSSMW